MNPRINDYEILPPIVEARFEDFCLDFFQELWNDDDAQPVGKKGSGQNGVDISGRPNNGSDWYGAQCKNKEQLTGKQLNQKRDVEEEIVKALEFKPNLKSYVVITTATRNADIQEFVRLKTEEHREKGLFEVKVYFWEDVVKKLIDKTPKTFAKWFPSYVMPQTVSDDKPSELKKAQIEITDAVVGAGNKVNVIGDNNIVTIGVDENRNGKDDVHNAQIDTAKLLLEAHNPEKAIEVLDKLKSEIWSQCSDVSKFRITANLAFGYSQVGKLNEAARYFIEELQYKPDDEKALLDSATGFSLLENFDEAKKKIEEVLAKNPLSPRAWSLSINNEEDETTYEEILAKVPKALLENSGVNDALARAAMVRNNLKAAEGHLRKAIQEEKENFEIKSRLAEVLLQQVLDDEMVIFGDHVNDNNKKRAEEVVELFNEAWSSVEKTELKKYRTSWLINRSIAKRLLDDKEGSFGDVELAIETNPSEPSSIRSKASFLFETNKKNEAIKWLEDNNEVLETDPSLAFLLAGFLRETNQLDKAIEVLSKLISRPNGETKNHDAKRLLIELYLEKKDFEKAKETLELIPKTEDFSVLVLIDEARIKRAQGLNDDAVNSLMRAKASINEKTLKRLRLEVANALYSFEKYSEAAELFKGLVEDAEDDQLNQRYLNSLYRAGEYTDALNLIEGLKSKSGLTKNLLQFETAIYDEIGDPIKSEKICLEYLSENPEDKDVKIRLAIVKLRLRKIDEILPIITSIKDPESLEMPQFGQLVNLYQEAGEHKTALELAYELRRKFYSNPDAHLFYVNLFLATEKQNQPVLDRVEILNDTYVELTNAQGKALPYILEGRKDPDIRSGEINPDNSVYGELLTKKVGDKIKINPISDEELTVKEIKSKYVFAFQESLEKYNTHFPKAQGLIGFTFDSSTPETTEASIQKMLQQVTAVSDRVTPIEKAYKEGQITIGVFAELLKKSPIDIFYGLMSSPNNTSIRNSLGTKEEIEASKLLIKSTENPKLLIDITALITIHELGIADKLIEGFGKLGITQSTIDLLNESLSERKAMKSKGFMTISKQDTGFIREEITPEQVEKSTKYFEGIVAWVADNCELVVAEKMIPKGWEGKREMEDVFGKSFTDAMSIVAKKDYILFTDDERLRSYCLSEFGVNGVWTQLVLSELVQKGILTQEEYVDAVIKLVSFNFVHTSINKAVIYRTGEKYDWDLGKPIFLKVISLLGEGYSHKISSGLVAMDFITSIWIDEEVPQDKKEAVISAVLRVMVDKRDKIEVLAILRTVLVKMPLVDARVKEEIKDFLNKFSSNESL